MTSVWRARLAGAAAGLVGGLFGGGGGMVFLPLMSREKDLSPRQLFATCVAVILPVCGVSGALCLLQDRVELGLAAPYLVGGFLGGMIGGQLYGRVSPLLLRRIFALFLLYAGVRYLT